ncbi:MAG: 1-acyl-sn-glycerol-3-phosphate acyltransferase [Gammaproteobacteria bacterium]|nr:1-acyl-sn-glycerol-3-phosphate acyltransferase [Gammaproteobacteria bacterium]
MGDYIWIFLAVVLVILVWQIRRGIAVCKRANRTEWDHSWLNIIDGLNRLFCYRYHRLNVVGMRLPKDGPGIVVANHISGLDPFLLIASARRPLRFIIAREEYERFGLNWMFKAAGAIPVDRERRPEQALRAAIRALKDGEIVALFPHGKIHLPSEPPVKLKPGAGRLAQLSGSTLYPAVISDIKGEGDTVGALVKRSNAQIEICKAIAVEERQLKAIMSDLSAILDSKRPPI